MLKNVFVTVALVSQILKNDFCEEDGSVFTYLANQYT